MPFYLWSTTAASNATADPTINWAEGMSPSSVNDSARAMMARIAERRNDISGALTSGGTSTAYTLATNEAFDTLVHMDKQEITFIPNVTSGASPTLAVDGLTAAPLQTTPGAAVPAGALIAGTPYRFTYYNSIPAFILQGSLGVLPNGVAPISALSFASGPALAGATGAGNGATITIGTGFNISGTTLNAATPPQASFKNLAIKVASNTTVAITADFVTVTDGTNYQTLTFNSTINLGTTGVNALDAGTIAIDTWYAIWTIAQPNGAVAALASASFTSPTMPSGYTYKARVGAVRTIHASATLYGTWQLGRRAQYVVGLAQTSALPVMANGVKGAYSDTSPTWAAVSVSSFVPSTASRIDVSVVTNYNNQTDSHFVVAPNSSYGGALSTSPINPPPLSQVGTSSNAAPGAYAKDFLLESANLYVASDAAGFGLLCNGWEDNI